MENTGKASLEDLKTVLQKTGIKLTHQRLEIFREMMASTDHPSAEMIHNRLKSDNPTLSLDTVYRTLATFSELGIIEKLNLMGERALFDGNLDRHHHFICKKCKKVTDIFWPEFDTSVLPFSQSGFGKIQSRHLELRGICNRCLDN